MPNLSRRSELLVDQRQVASIAELPESMDPVNYYAKYPIPINNIMPTSSSGEPAVRSIDAFAVSAIDIFSELTLDQRERISNMLWARQFKTGQFIVSNASTSRNVYFLIHGKVRVCAYSAHGKQVQFEDLNPGKMFGEIAALDGGKRTSDCICISDATVARMKHTDFYRLLSEFPGVNQAVLLRLTSIIRRQMERVFEFSTSPVATRLRYELLRLGSANETGEPNIIVKNPPTHADIAARISTHREAVTKEIRKLEKQGIITWNRGQCVIHKINALAQD